MCGEVRGQFAPDGRRLYFGYKRNATSEIFTQDLSAPASKVLFDEGADATWPRVSPDGKRLSYVSYADDATGRLCVRELQNKLARHCFDLRGALEAEWIDSGELMLLSRPSVDGDLQLARLRLNGAGQRVQPIVARNMNSPTVSPPIGGGARAAPPPPAAGGAGRRP